MRFVLLILVAALGAAFASAASAGTSNCTPAWKCPAPPPPTTTTDTTTTTTPPPTSSPGQLFAPSSYLNALLAPDATLDLNSVQKVSDLASQASRYGTAINSSTWTTRVYEVPVDQPTMTVVLDQSNPDLQAAWNAVPLPPDALPDTQSDHHLTVWQKATDTIWEFWGFYWSGTTPHAKYGGRMQNVSTNPGHFIDDIPNQHKDWGATATSIPLLAGLIRYSEAMALDIPHAIAVAVPEQDCTWRNPAQRTDGGCSPVGHVSAGDRYRLPASFDVSALNCSPLCKAIATAVQKYGMVVRDHAGVVAMYGENTGVSWSTTIPGGKSLTGFPWDQLQALPPSID